MNVLHFGASGMIGQGVLRECLLDDRVKTVIAVVRAPLGSPPPQAPRARASGLHGLSSLAWDLATVDACFFCLGISSAGKRYRWLYVGVSRLYPLLRRLLPRRVTTTENLAAAEGR